MQEFSYISLSSCSAYGNAYLVISRCTRILVDCGISCRRMESYLHELGIPPSSLDAIFLTHEHTDHTRALALKRPFACRHGVSVFAPPAFWEVWSERGWQCTQARTISAGHTVAVGDLQIHCFSKPHDTVDPVGYLVENRGRRLGIVTDLGEVPPELTGLLSGAEHLIFESNHDRQLQLESGRSRSLIQRVLGERGHLSNEQAGRALSGIATSATRTVLLAHLSLECNTPALAHRTVTPYLAQAGFKGELALAPPGRPGSWLG
ncbi:MAG: MBL fold metallo-hydrolase [Bacillota bacterium]